MSGAVKGVDVSSWQHPGQAEIDWHAVADDGYTFALVKATQGTNYVNNWLSRDLDDARSAGLLLGAYHYLEANVTAPGPGQSLHRKPHRPGVGDGRVAGLRAAAPSRPVRPKWR